MTPNQATFREFLLSERANEGLDKDLIFLLEDIATSCRIISHQIRGGAFAGRLGATQSTNVQGETQKQLDVIANDVFVRHCSNCKRVAALVSEEVDEVYWLKDKPEAGDYLVYFDPLDGSSNLDVNLSVGSIFSISQLPTAIDATDDRSVLRAGAEQISAGYSVYGPSTALVVTTGNGVNGFTHQQGTGEFRLTFPDMTIPEATGEFAINASRYTLWEPPIRRYFDECIQGKKGPRGKTFNMRWTASMVAEVHRILTRGGVFMYPKDAGNADMGGKLRLMYEANPMALVVEQAGGAASTGQERILDVQPTSHHQRVSVILGSKEEVEVLDQYHAQA
ncbi:class 1 fructose-bisphosphatase [Actibacterium pelagium]|uniref:Fructose-1,6-bisphosphatase class 1 n=1 Tax=Actibacterium pelagium TaxID=2029103 RepID=A0A917EM75_9RHOB|nr:class 1 fructose-bisphosphatase [Actibacterium pelagium]GGE62225.1 fructose-1,6-bisphosphatase class 1 [Actibacterium pelagium]